MVAIPWNLERILNYLCARLLPSCCRYHLKQGPMCDLGKGTPIIDNTCRIIKLMCIVFWSPVKSSFFPSKRGNWQPQPV